MLQALCSLQTGAMLRQQRPDLFRQEFPEVAVDRQLAGQKPYRVLPFEASQIRLVHEVTQYALQALRQRAGDLDRHSKVLRLGLTQPAQRIAVHDAGARLVRAVGPSPVLQRSRSEEHTSEL